MSPLPHFTKSPSPPTAIVTYHTLPCTTTTTTTTPTLKESLLPILTLSNTIFNIDTTVPEDQRTHHSRLDEWYRRLSQSNGDGVVIYATVPRQRDKSGVTVGVSDEVMHQQDEDDVGMDGGVVGFLFAFPQHRSSPGADHLSRSSPSASTSTSKTVAILTATPAAASAGVTMTTISTIHIWLAGVGPTYRSQRIFPRLLSHLFEHARERGYRKVSICTYPARFEKMYAILTRSGWVEVEKWEDDGKVYLEIDV